MRKLGKEINQTLAAWESSSEEARINLRIRQVRDRYRRAIEEVYKENAQFHLAHTNSVIITAKRGVKTLIVYVDDSIFAAELNAQRELVWLKLLEMFGEEIDDFQIKISKGTKDYADNNKKKVQGVLQEALATVENNRKELK